MNNIINKQTIEAAILNCRLNAQNAALTGDKKLASDWYATVSYWQYRRARLNKENY